MDRWVNPLHYEEMMRHLLKKVPDIADRVRQAKAFLDGDEGMPKTFFTSDLHLGHANVIRYSRRPFSDVEAMNMMLVHRWNSTIGPEDKVYVLGDVSFMPLDKTLTILDSLNGTKHLVAGNHDVRLRKKPEFCDKFKSVSDYLEINIGDKDAPEGKQHIVLCHYPILSWNRSRYGSWMLHGHTHGNASTPSIKRYDVGVDPNDFNPVSYDEIKAKFVKAYNVDH